MSSVEKACHYILDQLASIPSEPLYWVSKTKLFHTGEKLARFILPVMDAMETWGGVNIPAQSFIGSARGHLDWVKEANCSLHSIEKWYENGMEGTEKGLYRHFHAAWENSDPYLITGIMSLSDISASLGLLSNMCATIKFWEPQNYASKIGAPLAYLSPHIGDFANKIANTSIYRSLLAENIKPIKDTLYAASASLSLVVEVRAFLAPANLVPARVNKKKCAKDEKADKENVIGKRITLLLKMSKLTATILGGRVFGCEFMKHKNGSLGAALVAGTLGIGQILVEISKQKIRGQD